MMNFIFGSSGFAREVDWLIDEIFRFSNLDFRPHFFVTADSNAQTGQIENIISETEFFERYADKEIRCFLGIGSPMIKKKIHEKIRLSATKAEFPNLIHPSVVFDKRRGKVKMGIGNIICANNIITTDVTISDFVTLNLSCTVGHDCFIDSYTTISPGVNLSGRVDLEQGVYIGTGARIIEGLRIAQTAIVGAGATVVSDIPEAGTYVGTPAKKIK